MKKSNTLLNLIKLLTLNQNVFVNFSIPLRWLTYKKNDFLLQIIRRLSVREMERKYDFKNNFILILPNYAN